MYHKNEIVTGQLIKKKDIAPSTLDISSTL